MKNKNKDFIHFCLFVSAQNYSTKQSLILIIVSGLNISCDKLDNKVLKTT